MMQAIYNINYEELLMLKDFWAITFDPKLKICHADHHLNNHPTLHEFSTKFFSFVSRKLNYSSYTSLVNELYVDLYFGMDLIYYLKVRYANPKFAKNNREDILFLIINDQIDVHCYINNCEKIIKEKEQLEKSIINDSTTRKEEGSKL